MPYKPNINELLEKLQQSPNDDKLLTQIAFYYMQHPDGNKDLEYFNKAYQVSPSIENTHNLASWSYHEYGDKTALELQQQVLQKQPKSYYPYVAYAQMLATELEHFYSDCHFNKTINASDSISYYQQIIQNYQLAIQKFSIAPLAHQQRHCHLPSLLYHNRAWAMAMLSDYHQALNQLNKSEQLLNTAVQQHFIDMPNQDMLADTMYKILLNKIRLYILLSREKVDRKKEALQLIEQTKKHPNCDDIDIADLYAQLGEYELSYQTIIDKVDNIDESWQWIWYAIYQCNKEQWQQLLRKNIDNHLAYIEDLEQQNEQLQAENDLVMLADNLSSIKSEQQQLEQKRYQLEYMSQPKPSDKIKHSLQHLHLGCLLFGCPLHGNNINDDNQYIFNRN
ncbi:hypothetical protein [Psychrobacter sp. I-STPA10]|uniref:hypothetical protein n=1 Tax=Psychrobacter sp. I-STPA10 TaxID=2585769 RepID=UPI001E57D2CC|nr:hypothetical protein [Psychrobacter sp. I-STPA10]